MLNIKRRGSFSNRRPMKLKHCSKGFYKKQQEGVRPPDSHRAMFGGILIILPPPNLTWNVRGEIISRSYCSGEIISRSYCSGEIISRSYCSQGNQQSGGTLISEFGGILIIFPPELFNLNKSPWTFPTRNVIFYPPEHPSEHHRTLLDGSPEVGHPPDFGQFFYLKHQLPPLFPDKFLI